MKGLKQGICYIIFKYASPSNIIYRFERCQFWNTIYIPKTEHLTLYPSTYNSQHYLVQYLKVYLVGKLVKTPEDAFTC